MRARTLSWVVTIFALCGLVGAAPLAAARGGAPGRGGGSAHVNGCKVKQFSRLPMHTSKHQHQAYAEYQGQIVSADGSQKAFWDVLVDQCKSTPKIAVVSGGIPAFICPNPSGEFFGYNAALFGFLKHELAITNGHFSASGLFAGRGDGDLYSISATVTGKVTIAKRGRGKGHSTITGTLTDETFCPGSPLTFTVKFFRTWSYIGFGQGE